MPFESEKQRRWMHANEPEMAERWEHEMGSNYHRGENDDDSDYKYPSSGVHPLLEGPADPRGGFTDHPEAHLIAMVDNGACFDIESGELGYKIARDYGSSGYGVGGVSGGTP